MACYKARGFLQKAESLGLTAFGLGQTMFVLRVATTRSIRENAILQGSSKWASLFVCAISTNVSAARHPQPTGGIADVSGAAVIGLACPSSLQGHAIQRLGIRIFGRCFRCFRSLSFRNLRFGRWRLGWLFFGGLFGGRLLLLFLRRLLNLFHFIFVSHGKHSPLLSPDTKKINGIHMNITQAWLTVNAIP
jgi:hypothetical protein